MYSSSIFVNFQDTKHINIYHATNRTKFDVVGGLNISVKQSGQDMALMAKHLNRTVKLWTNYHTIDKQFTQHSKLELAPTAWISYDLKIVNKTKEDSSEAQEIQIDVSYPKRNLTVLSSYEIKDSELLSNLALMYDCEYKRKVEGEFRWKKDTTHRNRHLFDLIFRHPTFEKDITMKADYSTADVKLIDLGLVVDYSTEANKLVNGRGVLENHSNNQLFNYTYSLVATHPQTSLDLNGRGVFVLHPRLLSTKHFVDYQRSYLPLQFGEAVVLVDVDNLEVEFKRNTATESTHLWGVYNGSFPYYLVNTTAIYGKETNATGYLFVDFENNLVKMDMNLTEG